MEIKHFEIKLCHLTSEKNPRRRWDILNLNSNDPKYIILVYIWEDFFYYNSIWLKTILFFFLSNYFFFLQDVLKKDGKQ